MPSPIPLLQSFLWSLIVPSSAARIRKYRPTCPPRYNPSNPGGPSLNRACFTQNIQMAAGSSLRCGFKWNHLCAVKSWFLRGDLAQERKWNTLWPHDFQCIPTVRRSHQGSMSIHTSLGLHTLSQSPFSWLRANLTMSECWPGGHTFNQVLMASSSGWTAPVSKLGMHLTLRAFAEKFWWATKNTTPLCQMWGPQCITVGIVAKVAYGKPRLSFLSVFTRRLIFCMWNAGNTFGKTNCMGPAWSPLVLQTLQGATWFWKNESQSSQSTSLLAQPQSVHFLDGIFVLLQTCLRSCDWTSYCCDWLIVIWLGSTCRGFQHPNEGTVTVT